jgi:hypothetical protein
MSAFDEKKVSAHGDMLHEDKLELTSRGGSFHAWSTSPPGRMEVIILISTSSKDHERAYLSYF